ncbi:CD3337/EF1877 family mobilome membrane protein [Macrococcus capreoli]|uniref:CD3337/EF1877 family mobilome membrane protein n=1 Tax=Macrococcus capreoli TaxID=2982690 RepID=UPI0021D6055F|nr:hypothetical protein [Macrococcus sp. TMW 2.2395]MCU7557641.1 hypothetical protein [Macrococcus sp. TMW 2.2395]
MKRKYYLILCFFLLFLFVNCHVANANNGLNSNSNGAYEIQTMKDALNSTNPLVPNVEIVEAKIESKDKPLDNYRPNFKKDEDWNPWGNDEIAGTMNAFTTFIFDINKIIVQVTDYSLEHLYSLDVIDDFAAKISDMVNILYMSLSQNILAIFFVIAMVNIYFLMAVKGDIGEFFKRFALLCLVIGIGSGVLSNVEPIVKGINSFGKSVNTVLLNGTQFSQTGSIFSEDNGINNVRNRYFDTTVLRPYLLMNYNSVDEKALKKEGKDRVDNLLELKNTEKNSKKIEKILDVEETDYKNTAILQSNVMKQLGIAIITLITTIIFSLIFLGVSLLKLILSAFSLLLVIFCVFSFVISFLPKMEYSMFKAFKTTFGYIILSTCVTFVFVLFTLVQQIIDMFIPPNTMSGYLLNVISVFITLYVLFIKRNEILSFVTNGNVTFSPKRIGDNASALAFNNYKQRRELNKILQERKRIKQEPKPIKSGEKQNVIRSNQRKKDDVQAVKQSPGNSSVRTQQSDVNSKNMNDIKKNQEDNQSYAVYDNNQIERQEQNQGNYSSTGQTDFKENERQVSRQSIERSEQIVENNEPKKSDVSNENYNQNEKRVITRTEQTSDMNYSNQDVSNNLDKKDEVKSRNYQDVKYSNNFSQKSIDNGDYSRTKVNDEIKSTGNNDNSQRNEMNDTGRLNKVNRMNEEQKERNKSYE